MFETYFKDADGDTLEIRYSDEVYCDNTHVVLVTIYNANTGEILLSDLETLTKIVKFGKEHA